MQVRRGDHLVHDTMLQLQNAATQGTLKQPLRVKFAGEEGVDEGGVSKVLPMSCTLSGHTQILGPSEPAGFSSLGLIHRDLVPPMRAQMQ